MPENNTRSIDFHELSVAFGDPFRYISVWQMADNVSLFALREVTHDPHHRQAIVTKSISEKIITRDGGIRNVSVVSFHLERLSPHSEAIFLRGSRTFNGLSTPIEIAITREGAIDSSGVPIIGTQERQLVNLIHRLMQPDDPNAVLD